jgi:pyruvate dehydrogenase E1 component alpha subunit
MARKATTARSKSTKVDKEQVKKFYTDMLLIRRFEEKAGQIYGMGLIGGFCHLYIGQEAVVVGMQSAINPDDAVITSYRDHGHMLACGMDPKGVMAELTGREGGYSRGKGGSMHMFSKEKNFYGGHGIVGACVPLGTGLAFSQKYDDTDNVTLCYMGDGTVNQGQVYESASAQTELFRRGESFNVPGEQVDGMDVFAVAEAGRKAVEWARSGKGPYILEMKTYRYRGHSMSDPAKYRSKEEVNKKRAESDPIERVREKLLNDKVYTEDELKEIDRDVKAIVAKAVEFAQESPEPHPDELMTDIVA